MQRGMEAQVPTTFGLIVLILLAVGAVVGLVLWVRSTQRRTGEVKPPAGHEAPYDAEAAAARQARNFGTHGSV
jgi:uncharacterized membrane protein